MKTKNKEMINVENLLLGNQALYRELLYKLARDYEYQGDYQSAIERYKEMVKLGTKEGITEIAKIYIICTCLAVISNTRVSLDFNKLFLWLKKISDLYPEEVFKTIYLFLALKLPKSKEQLRYKTFLAKSTNKIAKKYYKSLSKGE